MGIECARSRNIHTNLAKCEHYYFCADLAKHSIIGANDVYVYMHALKNFPFYLDDPS